MKVLRQCQMIDSVAVIIPTYNRRHTIGRALSSVYGQTVLPDEVYVVDDGSVDDTEQFVRSNFPDVNYLKQPNQGVSAARNVGIANTKSEWIAFLDSDDEWLPGKLERQKSEAAESGSKLVHCDEIWIRNGVRVNQMNKHRKYGGNIFEHCLPLCAISPSAVLLHRYLLLEVGGFDESLPACEDYDLWLRICSRYPVLYIDEQLLNKFGGHEDQLSRQHWGMDRFRVQALDNLLAAGGLTPEQALAAKSMLVKKCTILRDGARKRDNHDLVNKYSSLLGKYQDEISL